MHNTSDKLIFYNYDELINEEFVNFLHRSLILGEPWHCLFGKFSPALPPALEEKWRNFAREGKIREQETRKVLYQHQLSNCQEFSSAAEIIYQRWQRRRLRSC